MKNTEKKPLSSLKKGNLKKRSKKRAKKGDLKQTQQPQVQRFKKNLKNWSVVKLLSRVILQDVDEDIQNEQSSTRIQKLERELEQKHRDVIRQVNHYIT